jgi:hypothetical protein
VVNRKEINYQGSGSRQSRRELVVATFFQLLAVTTGPGQVTANDLADGVAQSQNGSMLLLQWLLFEVAVKVVNQHVNLEHVVALTENNGQDLSHHFTDILFVVMLHDLKHFDFRKQDGRQLGNTGNDSKKGE